MSIQNSQTGMKPWYRLCARCGKQTFSDLLDSEGMCDYCREIKSMKVAVIRSKNGRKGRK